MLWKMKKKKEIMQCFEWCLLNAMKNEQNKGNNDAMRLSWKFFFYRRLCPLAHLVPFSYFGFKTTSQLSIGIFFCDRRLSPLAHLGQFSYFSYDGKMMRKDVSGGWEVKIQKIRKNDEKRRFRRSKVKVKKSEKMMRKDFQEVERSKIKKSEKMMRKDVSRSQRSKFKK